MGGESFLKEVGNRLKVAGEGALVPLRQSQGGTGMKAGDDIAGDATHGVAATGGVQEAMA